MTLRAFRSFAKVNLGLEVVRLLPEGYHELRTLFATLSLHDIVEFRPRRRGIVVRTDHPDVPDGPTNLAWRAAEAMQRLSGRRSGIDITIHKRIAAGGGLGGGSSNAATVLRALNRIWNANIDPARLHEAAAALGADVPYFLVGGPALGLGRGDDIHPIDLSLQGRVLLVQGPGGVSTGEVFRAYGATRGAFSSPSRIEPFLKHRRAGPADTSFLGRLRNDLEAAAISVSAPLRRTARAVRQAGTRNGAIFAAMSGSGSSFFLVFEHADARKAATRDLRALGHHAVACAFVSRSAFERRFEITKPGKTARVR